MFSLRSLSRALFFASAYVCLPIILATMTTDVVLRYVFNSPLRWAQELATLLLFLSLVLALPESWVRNAHVRADFLKNFIGVNGREAIERAVWAVVLVVSIVIIVQCLRDIQFMIQIRERTAELRVPMSWMRGVLAVSAFVCVILAMAKLFSLRRILAADEGNDQ